MLTKDESIYLAGILREKYIASKNCTLLKNFIDVIYETVKLFEEKQKREIKVGDIYRNLEGTIQEIISVGETSVRSNTSSYYMDGAFNAGDYNERDYSRLNLNLSKKYKLVEIEE